MPKYPITPEMEARLAREGVYHAPFGDQQERYVLLRDAITAVKRLVLENTPPSREQSLALTHLDDATYSANAAIARNEVPGANSL